MKHLLLTSALACATALNAQTTALDFTANDCDGMSHTLFADLDAGYTVVLELVMMGCQPCVDAAHSITDNVLPNVSDPTMVKYYSVGFTNSITCAQMNDWKTTNGFTNTVFAGMSAQTTYYGGMGMPTIAILGGGSDHTVCLSQLGHSDSDNPAIIAAINTCLAGASGLNEVAAQQVGVSPNPATDVLTIAGTNWTKARVTDIQGREVLNVQLIGGKLDVAALLAGAYVLQLTDASGATGMARFEKR
ncbi:MAG: T9SS type A sorting domain-containing protein [Flavobacteriales bacterium]|nr:T9SS type A sorting domain-containing protein [Flavobacteriales bacterium]MBK7940561.1 T9SS type A sorting domain-containing protein [Flavobacteriales bacterium]MBK8950304.1 T9SS type A sorting domain-containing protein [Flavobacteriales bacterium]MBK9701020.1 T9SS type A sorting domain-containing protein [Flavobacteriales bacterium]